ncbi:MAG TPA: hypothetical protein VGC04_11200 [Cellulomonas sp.]
MSERTPIRADAPAQEAGWQLPTFDPMRPTLFSSWGRKGSGKSTFNRRIARSWATWFDELVVDVNGDADPGPAAIPVRRDAAGLLPGAFPEAERLPGAPAPGPRTLVFRADPGSATYADDLDRAVGMVLYPQTHRCLGWFGEIGEFTPNAQSTRPHMRRLLMQNRHYLASALFDGPRPMNVDPLILGQSDYVAIFDLPNPADRDRVANTIGWKPTLFDKECDETFGRGEFWYLFYDAREHTLYRCPPLPPLQESAPAPR